MFSEYTDILDKIPEPPQWGDEHRGPRYVEFAPHRVADIYADEAALAEIACFGCLTIYKLACSSLDFEAHERIGLPMADAIRRGDLQLCDPPNPGCCRDGPSTGCYNLKILQYWCRRNDGRNWTRDPSLEIDLPKTKPGAAHRRPSPKLLQRNFRGRRERRRQSSSRSVALYADNH